MLSYKYTRVFISLNSRTFFIILVLSINSYSQIVHAGNHHFSFSEEEGCGSGAGAMPISKPMDISDIPSLITPLIPIINLSIEGIGKQLVSGARGYLEGETGSGLNISDRNISNDYRISTTPIKKRDELIEGSSLALPVTPLQSGNIGISTIKLTLSSPLKSSEDILRDSITPHPNSTALLKNNGRIFDFEQVEISTFQAPPAVTMVSLTGIDGDEETSNTGHPSSISLEKTSENSNHDDSTSQIHSLVTVKTIGNGSNGSNGSIDTIIRTNLMPLNTEAIGYRQESIILDIHSQEPSGAPTLTYDPHPPTIVTSLDGGGFRGIIQAAILERIHREYGIWLPRKSEVVLGTSIGSIVGAAAIIPSSSNPSQYLFHSPTQITELFNDINSNRIFRRSILHSISTLGGLTGPRYDRTQLDLFLHQHFGTLPLNCFNSLAPINSSGYKHRFLASSLITEPSKRSIEYWFDSAAPLESTFSFSLLDAIRGSSAAPTYYASAILSNGSSAIDGGLFANNPSNKVLDIMQEWDQRKKDKTHIFSLGTGIVPLDVPEGDGKLDWATHVAQLMLFTSTNNPHNVLKSLFSSSVAGPKYYRFQPSLEKGRDTLDAHSSEQRDYLLGKANEHYDIIINTWEDSLRQLSNYYSEVPMMTPPITSTSESAGAGAGRI